MIHLLALVLTLSSPGSFQQPSSHKWHSRAEFCAALNQVNNGWTKAQVKALLGPPDDVGTAGNLGDTWRYGTNGHNTFPTLGQVQFEGAKVESYSPYGGEPPSTSLVTDAEMTSIMRTMYSNSSENEIGFGSDPVRLIRIANMLIPMGQEKAVAVLGEYARYAEIGDQDWLFLLVRAMFTSNKPGGVFPVPAIGAISPSPPKDLKTWPTYPLLMVDDIPIDLIEGILLGGYPEQFRSYFERNHADWTLRSAKLRPPDDPFVSASTLLASPRWKKMVSSGGQPGSFWGGRGPDKATVYVKVERLVHNCVSDDSRSASLGAATEFESLHQRYLKVGGHWDETKQMYVRKDGTFTADRSTVYPEREHVFNGIPDLDLSVTLHRRDEDNFEYWYWVRTYKTESTEFAKVILEDMTTNKELDRYALKPPEPYDPKTSSDGPGLRPKGVVTGSWGHGSGFPVPAGHKVRVVVIDHGKKYTSPIFTP